MIRNSLTIGKKEFARNKLLSAINLLAIVGALVLITLASSWVYLTFWPTAPAQNARNFVYVDARDQSGKYKEVTMEHYETINRAVKGGFIWYYSQAFILLTLNKNNKKISYSIISSDLNFWKALNFNFLHGSPFTEEQYKNKAYVVLISDRFARAYFGSDDALGKYLIYGKYRFKVQGVFEAISLNHHCTQDIFFPHSLMPERSKNMINACFAAKDKQGLIELEAFLKKYNQAEKADSDIILYTRPYLRSITDPDRDYQQLGALLAAFVLPILCFANLFMRKMELKLPELAIKRALGATRKNLFVDLVIGNLLYITIAGAIALLLAHPLIGFAFNPTGAESIATSFLTSRFYFITLTLYLVFGVLSALRPAWKVSGKSIVSTLNYA